MTQASITALEGLRDLASIKWYVIPLLAYTFYIYATEVKRGRKTGDWNAVFAGLTVFGMDFINETWNGWVLVLGGRSAFWTAPGDTALRTMVGWNIEIMFMFIILGIIFYHSLSADFRNRKILGLPEDWFIGVFYSAFCVFIEVLLNIGGHLVWEYPFWSASFGGVWLIFFLGYFHFFVAAILVIRMKSFRNKAITVAAFYSIAVLMNIFGMGIMGWTY